MTIQAAAIVLALLLSSVVQAEETESITIRVQYGQSAARSMLDLINAFRTGSDAWYWNEDNKTKTRADDLSPLQYDYALEQYAMQRAAEIALFYDHERPDGNICTTEALSMIHSVSPYSYSVGENIAAGYGSYTTAASVFNGWQETDENYAGQGHRRNMLDSEFTSIGIGHVFYNGCHYWVQEFGAPTVSAAETTAVDSSKDVSVRILPSIVKGLTAAASFSSIQVNINETETLPELTADLSISGIWPDNKTGRIENPVISWQSSDSSIAAISGNAVKGLKKGKTTLTANVSAAGKTAEVAVDVTVFVPVTGIRVTPGSSRIMRGAGIDLSVGITPENASVPDVIWKSSNTKVATVDHTGHVTAVKAGKAVITATAKDTTKGTFSAESSIEVYEPVTGISLDRKTLTAVLGGESVKLKASLKPSDATNQSVIWESSNTDAVSVSRDGTVKAVGEGSAVITATAADKSKGTFSATCKVSVHIPVSKLEGGSTEKTVILKGDSAVLTVKVLPANATDPSVTWKSSDSSVAVVSENGRVTGKAAGTAVITAAAKDQTNPVASVQYPFEVFVPVKSISLKEKTMTLQLNKTAELHAVIAPSDATDQRITWTSSNPDAVTVDGNGKMKAVGEGNATITALTAGDEYGPAAGTIFSASAEVTVHIPADGDSPEPTATPGATGKPEPTATPGATGKSEATVTPEPTGKPEPTATPTPTVTPTPAISEEDQTTKAADGTAVGKGASEKTAEKAITAVSSDEGPKGTKFAQLMARQKKVTKNSIRITWKKIAGAKYIVYGNKCGKGKKFRKLATVTKTSFTQKKLKKGNYYKYLVVAVKKGKVVSTSKTLHIATSGGKVGNTRTVKLSKKKLRLKKGKTKKLKVTTKPESRKRKVKKHRKIAWESSNPAVATVSAKGKVKALKKGTCYIYAYAQNGKYARCKVTVK